MERSSLAELGISVETSAMDVPLMSRKKEFKPMVDGALAAGWRRPPPTKGDQSLVLVVKTATDHRQKLKREFSIGNSQ